MINTIAKVRKIIDKLLLSLISILLIVMVVGVTWQVFSRYVLNDPSAYTQELLQFLLIWVTCLAAAYVFGIKQHIAFIFLKNKVKKNQQVSLQILIDVIVILFIGSVFIKGGVSISTSTLSQLSPVLRIPMGFVYYILPISGAIIIFYQILNIIDLKHNKNLSTNGGMD